MNWFPRPDGQLPFAARAAQIRCRSDLVIKEVTTANGIAYVIKDPLNLRIYRISPVEYAILNALQPEKTWTQIVDEIQKRYRTLKIQLVDVQALVQKFCKLHFVVDYRVGSENWLAQASRTSQQQNRTFAFTNLLAIKLGAVDPDPVLRSLKPLFGWLFHPLTITLQLCLIFLGIGVVVANADVYIAELPPLERWIVPNFYFPLLCILVITKICHEFAHAITCKHFGGECHRLGVLLLLFIPTLYVDTSDSWLLKRPGHRALVALAGVWAELMIAAFASLVWVTTPQGSAHSLSMQVILLCSISTLLVNANPLLKYDGYFLLSDFLNMHNLSARSHEIVIGSIRSIFLGVPQRSIRGESRKRHCFLWVYGIASFLYRAFLLFVVAFFICALADKIALRQLGYCIVFVIAVRLGYPALKQSRSLLNQVKLLQPKRQGRVILLGLTLVVASLWLLSTPLPVYIHGSGLVYPTQFTPVYLPFPGRLCDVSALAGEPINKGDLIARFENPQLQWQIAELQAKRDVQSLRVRQCERLAHVLPNGNNELLTARVQLADLEAQLERRQQQVEKLSVHAANDGLLLDLSSLQTESNFVNDRGNGAPKALARENLGAWFETGHPLLSLCTDARPMVEVYVSEQEANRIQEGDPALVRLDGLPTMRFHGHVRTISKKIQEQLPLPVTTASDGGVIVTQEGQQLKPWEQQYVVLVIMEGENLPKGFGQRAQVKVLSGKESLMKQGWRLVSRLKWMQ